MRSGSRRLRWGAAAVATAGLVVLVNHVGSPSPVFRTAGGQTIAGYSASGALLRPTKSDIAQVVQALDTRARAIRDGDEPGFLGGLDTDRRSFGRSQQTAWSNTQRLPLTDVSFAFAGVLEPDARLRTPTFLAHVVTTYELSGYDSSPVQVDDGFSFEKVDGTWKLASVSDADLQFVKGSLPVPWDGGPVDSYGDGRYLAVVDRGHQALARRIVARCHRGTRAVDDLLGTSFRRPTVVLATTRSEHFRKFEGIDALAVTAPLAGPDGVTPGWRVEVNPHDVAETAASTIVLPHEITHLATQDYLADLPSWLAEGAAEYVGWHSHGGLVTQMRARGFGVRRTLPDRLPSTATFYRSEDIDLDYTEGMGLVTYIAESHGPGAVLALMRAYEDMGGYQVDFDPDAATPAIVNRVLGTTPGALARAAYRQMESQVPRA